MAKIEEQTVTWLPIANMLHLFFKNMQLSLNIAIVSLYTVTNLIIIKFIFIDKKKV